ncbi:MAG: aldehyde ferredoxin oxidoreductase family protein [Halobacteriota archaeon]|nr:aldehyde ferredoxin oxidoreductase family protein [Halobacteriota archaeon]
MGEMLRINLSSDSIKTEEMDMDLAEKFLGGRGLGVKILYDELEPKTDPLSPDNKIIFATGPVTGTGTPTAGRWVVVSKSPISETVFDSLCGGSFGSELKYAGFDVLILEGRAPSLSYICIDDGEVQIYPAEKYSGLDTVETQEAIKKDIGEDFKVACIGPAGEKLVRYAIIRNEHRGCTRNGPGALMGSKNLKAIAVRGTGDVSVDDMKKYKEVYMGMKDLINKNPTTAGGSGAMYNLGTAAIYDVMNMFGALASNNYQSIPAKESKKLSPVAWSKKNLKAKKACFGCPIACGRWIGIEEGVYAGTHGEGPEFQALGMLGSNLGLGDINTVLKENDMCNSLGLDTLSTGNVIGFAMECFEKGLISVEDTDGLDLKFGNGEAAVSLIEKIVKREGFGDLMAEGVKRASEKIGKGSEKFAMHMKNMEMSSYDCRGAYGQALGYATSNRGGSHMQSWVVLSESTKMAFPIEVDWELTDRMSPKGKPNLVKKTQDWMAAVNSTVLCIFTGFGTTIPTYGELVSAATGFEIDGEGFMEIGERIFLLERAFNAREGFGRRDDILPSRFLEEEFEKGASKKSVVPIEEMLNEYYELRGLDSEGHPTKEKMQELGL